MPTHNSRFDDKPLAASQEAAQIWRWRFADGGPPLTDVLQVGELLRAAATRISFDCGWGPLPDFFHHDTGNQHGHAFWLPYDANCDGLIDHALVYRDDGIPGRVIAALAQVEILRVGGTSYRLLRDWMGPLMEGWPFGPATIWQATTPYVTSNWRLTKTGKERPDFTPGSQLLTEIQSLGLPPPLELTWSPYRWIGEQQVIASAFAMTRRKGTRAAQPPKDALASFPTIVFPEPIMGPLAFGYGAHFGLGALAPVCGTAL